MPDDMDAVQALNEQHIADCLDNHRRKTSEVCKGVLQYAPTVCIECGEKIPEVRRKAAPGCTRCIDCQTDYETHIHRRRL